MFLGSKDSSLAEKTSLSPFFLKRFIPFKSTTALITCKPWTKKFISVRKVKNDAVFSLLGYRTKTYLLVFTIESSCPVEKLGLVLCGCYLFNNLYEKPRVSKKSYESLISSVKRQNSSFQQFLII